MRTSYTLNTSGIPKSVTCTHNNRVGTEIKPESYGCDSRYQNIISRLAGLSEMSRRVPSIDLATELDQLLTLMLFHTNSENNAMKLLGYPRIAQHGLNHFYICSNAAKLRQVITKGDEVITPQKLDSLLGLWLDHFETHDKAFEEFLEHRS